MTNFQPYCETSKNDKLNRIYHDKEYGFPVRNDSDLFERLVLEINQAGLSWSIILQKKNSIRRAFDNYDILKVSNYNEYDRNRLLDDKGIIRNRLKVDAVIKNASVIRTINENYGSFASWLDFHAPLQHKEWVSLFRKTFLFTGPKIVNEFLMSTGYLSGAHNKNCPVYNEIIALSPPWMREINTCDFDPA